MLKLPGDEFVTIELVHDPSEGQPSTRSGLSHFVIQVHSMDLILRQLASCGINTDPPVSPGGSPDFLTTWITDPDENRIELVQWIPGHPDGMTAADFAI